MPELPEVETVVRSLARSLTGRTITAIEVRHRPSISGSPARLDTAANRRIERVHRRGKFIRIDLSGGAGLLIHLRMTGWLGIVAASERDPGRNAHVRLRFILDDGTDALIFRDIRTFGRVWCGPLPALESLKALARLGPEPLVITSSEFVERLRSRGGRLKPLLLNQEFLAGVGNIYADEALFAARLHPLAVPERVKIASAQALHGAIQHILAAAIEAGGSSIDDFLHPDGQPGWFQRKLLVYGRAGQACTHCGAAIQRIVLNQRSTCFCPRCQHKK